MHVHVVASCTGVAVIFMCDVYHIVIFLQIRCYISSVDLYLLNTSISIALSLLLLMVNFGLDLYWDGYSYTH